MFEIFETFKPKLGSNLSWFWMGCQGRNNYVSALVPWHILDN